MATNPVLEAVKWQAAVLAVLTKFDTRVDCLIIQALALTDLHLLVYEEAGKVGNSPENVQSAIENWSNYAQEKTIKARKFNFGPSSPGNELSIFVGKVVGNKRIEVNMIGVVAGFVGKKTPLRPAAFAAYEEREKHCPQALAEVVTSGRLFDKMAGTAEKIRKGSFP